MIHTFNPQKDPYVQRPLLNTLRKNSKNFIIFLRLSLIFLLDKLHKLPNHCANNKVNYNKNENKEGEIRKYFNACEKNNFHSHLSRKNLFKKNFLLLVGVEEIQQFVLDSLINQRESNNFGCGCFD